MDINPTKIISPKNRIDWRDWLTKNHFSEKEIWVVFYKKSTGKQTVSYKEILDEALCFGWIDGIEKGIDIEKFAIRFTPRTHKSNWSEINTKRYKELLRLGVVTESGRRAFANKFHVYGSVSNKKGAIAWHQNNKMPKNPTLEERVSWHREHQKFCSCRPIPISLLGFFSKNTD